MRKGDLKQLIENAVFDVLKEVENEDESHMVPDEGEQGVSHSSHGDDNRFWGNRGAGILLIAQETGRMLLVLRSANVNEPGTWGLPGGKIDNDEESPSVAAKREAHEELGFSGEMQLTAAHVFKAGNFKFHNFIGVVPKEFETTLDWENDDSGWFAPNELPSPLHFGIQSLLSNSKGQITDIIDNL